MAIERKAYQGAHSLEVNIFFLIFFDLSFEPWPKSKISAPHPIWQFNWFDKPKIMISIQGNQSRAFLQKLDKFQHFVDQQPDSVVLEALPFIHTFRAFDKVVSSCFGVHLEGNYLAHIQEFRRLYGLLNISITPKVLSFCL